MKKAIIAVAGAAFLAGVALTPTPASAFLPLPIMYAIMKSKEDPNFKPNNPYATKVAKGHKHRMHKKKKM